MLEKVSQFELCAEYSNKASYFTETQGRTDASVDTDIANDLSSIGGW